MTFFDYDMHLLDLETMTWQDDTSNPNLTVGICNNVCSAIESVPNYKLFTFGGKKGIMDYINSVDVMDCGQLVWNTMNVMGKPPCPREATKGRGLGRAEGNTNSLPSAKWPREAIRPRLPRGSPGGGTRRRRSG